MRHHLKFVAVGCAAVGGVIGMAAEGEGEMTQSTRLPYRAWTAEEDARLRSMALLGTRPHEIAASLGRSRAAVQSRADKLGISLKLVTWRRGELGLKAKTK